MQSDIGYHLARSLQDSSLSVGAARWRVYILDVIQLGGDCFLQLALVGSRSATRTVTVCVPTPEGPRNPSAADVLRTVRHWIMNSDSDADFIPLA